jgi:hypothetical protein
LEWITVICRVMAWEHRITCSKVMTDHILQSLCRVSQLVIITFSLCAHCIRHLAHIQKSQQEKALALNADCNL